MSLKDRLSEFASCFRVVLHETQDALRELCSSKTGFKKVLEVLIV